MSRMVSPNRKKRSTRWIWVCLTGILPIFIFGLNSCWAPEPKVAGKSLSYWLEKMRAEDFDGAREMIRQMGTNAVPHLRRMIHSRDTAFKSRLADLVDKSHLRAFRIRKASEKHELAGLGLLALGKLSLPVIKELGQALCQETNDSRFLEIAADLGSIGPQAIPFLIEAILRPPRELSQPVVGMVAVGIRHMIGFEPYGAVEVLLPLLKSDNPAMRARAADYLGAGVHALAKAAAEDAGHKERRRAQLLIESVVQSLSLACQDTDDSVRTAAARALESSQSALAQKY